MLEFLDIGNNQIRDTFLVWLESLPKLKILISRSNKFHGEMKSREFNFVFPKLRVIDLSNNGFTSPLPSTYLEMWNAMKGFHVEHLLYMQTDLYDHMFMARLAIPDEYIYLKTLTNKGLQLLKLSNNDLVGLIPSVLGTLTRLEALDLSQNKLVGRIPL
ncbi:hypothetical protein PTKIN_Ptkin06aG0109900 [Pterospermum kingtungense]